MRECVVDLEQRSGGLTGVSTYLLVKVPPAVETSPLYLTA